MRFYVVRAYRANAAHSSPRLHEAYKGFDWSDTYKPYRPGGVASSAKRTGPDLKTRRARVAGVVSKYLARVQKDYFPNATRDYAKRVFDFSAEPHRVPALVKSYRGRRELRARMTRLLAKHWKHIEARQQEGLLGRGMSVLMRAQALLSRSKHRRMPFRGHKAGKKKR
jgi:hypothetical protein